MRLAARVYKARGALGAAWLRFYPSHEGRSVVRSGRVPRRNDGHRIYTRFLRFRVYAAWAYISQRRYRVAASWTAGATEEKLAAT